MLPKFFLRRLFTDSVKILQNWLMSKAKVKSGPCNALGKDPGSSCSSAVAQTTGMDYQRDSRVEAVVNLVITCPAAVV